MVLPTSSRKKLPDDRTGVITKFKIHVHVAEGESREVKGYIRTGEYPDGRLGEVFVSVGKPGSSDALLDEWAKIFSIALQYGVPLKVMLDKHIGTSFGDAGMVVDVPGITRCTSVLDLVCRWITLKYVKET